MIMSVNRDIEGFLCGFCNLPFYNISALKRHMQAHLQKTQQNLSHVQVNGTSLRKRTSGKPKRVEHDFRCGFCQNAIQRRTLELHVRAHFEEIHEQMPGVIKTVTMHKSERDKIDIDKMEEHDFQENDLSQKLTLLEDKSQETIKNYPGSSQGPLLQSGHSITGTVQISENEITRVPSREYSCSNQVHNKLYCSFCDKRLISASALEKHMQVHVHSGQICDICYKTFKEVACLREHMRCHNTSKPYTCSVCGRSFSSRHTRNRHMTRHYGVGEYVCGYCKKRFADANSLVAHIHIHPTTTYSAIDKRVFNKRLSRTDPITVSGAWSSSGRAFIVKKRN